MDRGGGLRLPIGRAGRGGGISGIIILVVLFFVLKAVGIDPLQLLEGGGGQTTSQQAPARNDEMKQFVATVLAETEDVWHGIFKAGGQTYGEPTLVLFSGQVRSACGFASSASGPFYCPGDSQVYIDLSFYAELSRRFKASGDFAQAYVLAHEVGHHVQNLIGVLPKFNRMRQSMSEVEANRMSVRVELQADWLCRDLGAFHGAEGLTGKGRSRGGLERGETDRRRYAAETCARLRGAGELQPRNLETAPDLVFRAVSRAASCRPATPSTIRYDALFR